MKPIIIGVTKDGKVDMTLDEFRKHMDGAYWQGYQDNTSSLTQTISDGKWWNNQPYCNLCNETTATTTLSDKTEG